MCCLIKVSWRWWDKNEEIDALGIGEDFLIAGECKYSNKKVGTDILHDLKKKRRRSIVIFL